MDGSWLLWLLVAAVLGPAEAMFRRLIFAAASVGSLSGAVAAALGASLPAQVLTVAAVSGAGLCMRRPLLRPYHRAVIRWDRMVGTATVTEQVNGQTGQVRYGGLAWPARSPGQTIATGTRVNVSGLFNDGVWVYPRDAVGHGATGPGRQAAVQLPQRVTWREASAAQGKLSGGYLLTPEENVRLLQLVTARRQANDRLFNRIFASVIGSICAFGLVVGAIALPSSIAAARGEGVRGVFTAQSFTFTKAPSWWTGTFRSDSGQVETDVSYFDRPPSGTRPGRSFPAIYRDGAAYAVHGSTTWLEFVFFMILAAGALVVIVWRGPIRALKRHRDLQQTRAGRGGNSLDQAPAS